MVVQADVCHAYHVVRRNGIPAKNVILMSYGDAAYSEENPFPGKLFNQPTQDGVAGYDVNEGCVATYFGEDVTASNFLAVLKGDNKTTGPSLNLLFKCCFWNVCTSSGLRILGGGLPTTHVL